MCSLRLSRKEGIGALGSCIETNVADEQLADTVHGPWSGILAPRLWSAPSSLAWGTWNGRQNACTSFVAPPKPTLQKAPGDSSDRT
jgi:hypothetical protein